MKVRVATEEGGPWVDVDGGKIFQANTNGSEKVEVLFAAPVMAKFIRLNP